MKFVSLNCKGLESTQKKLALKRMMEVLSPKFILPQVLSPKVILPQETMGQELEVETSLTSLLPQYSFTAQSAIGHSGGLAIGWKKTSIRCTNSRGACLYLNQSHFFQISLGLGTGTNSYAELMTLKLLLCFSNERNCRHLQVYGDSMVVING